MSDVKPYNVDTIADYVILSLNSDENYPLINLKLQKLIYYIQAWSLGINGESLFNARFEAWVHGPVCIELYNRFRNTKNLYSVITNSDVLNHSAKDVIQPNDVEFVDYILENYARCSCTQIEAMTHNEKPWIEARKGYEPMERCQVQITNEMMKTYYAQRYNEIPD